MSLRFIQNPWKTDVVNTTDATATVATNATYQPPTDSQGWVIVRAHAKTASGAAGSAEVRQAFKNVSGTLVLSGVLLTVAAGALGALIGDLTTAIVDVAVSGTTVQPRVKGVIATNIEWLVSAQYDVN